MKHHKNDVLTVNHAVVTWNKICNVKIRCSYGFSSLKERVIKNS